MEEGAPVGGAGPASYQGPSHEASLIPLVARAGGSFVTKIRADSRSDVPRRLRQPMAVHTAFFRSCDQLVSFALISMIRDHPMLRSLRLSLALLVLSVAVPSLSHGQDFDPDPAWPLCGRIADDPPMGWGRVPGLSFGSMGIGAPYRLPTRGHVSVPGCARPMAGPTITIAVSIYKTPIGNPLSSLSPPASSTRARMTRCRSSTCVLEP